MLQRSFSENSKVEIKPYGSEDQSQVVALWKTGFPDDPPWNEPVSVICRKLTVQPELLLIGHVNSRIVATVMAGFDGVRGWIHHLAVHAEYRRKGIATMLMHSAEQGLEAQGCLKSIFKSAQRTLLLFHSIARSAMTWKRELALESGLARLNISL